MIQRLVVPVAIIVCALAWFLLNPENLPNVIEEPLKTVETLEVGGPRDKIQTKEERYRDLLKNSTIKEEYEKLETEKERIELKTYRIKDTIEIGSYLYESGEAREKPTETAWEWFFGTAQAQSEDTYEIELTEVNIIDGGIEVFARAWKNDEQLGFGKDGSVDIERFLVYDPPALVFEGYEYSTSTEVTATSSEEVVVKTPILVEDPELALRTVLGQNVAMVGKENTTIIPNKVGNTTSTFYPDPTPETSSVDGFVGTDTESTWNAVHDATTGGNGNDTGSFTRVRSDFFSGPFYVIYRTAMTFDTGTIGSDGVDSATASIYARAVLDNEDDGNNFLSIVQSSLATTTVVALADFDVIGDAIDNPTEGHTTANRADLGSVSTSAYTDFPFNSTGEGWIQTTGITQLGVREGHDILDDPSNAGISGITMEAAEQTGSSKDPKLVVEHSAAAAPADAPILPEFLLISWLLPPLNGVSLKI